MLKPICISNLPYRSKIYMSFYYPLIGNYNFMPPDRKTKQTHVTGVISNTAGLPENTMHHPIIYRKRY